MRIIKNHNEYDKTCSRCTCQFIFSKEDTLDERLQVSVKCPECTHKITVEPKIDATPITWTFIKNHYYRDGELRLSSVDVYKYKEDMVQEVSGFIKKEYVTVYEGLGGFYDKGCREINKSYFDCSVTFHEC